MAIPYALYPNYLTPDPTDRAARVLTYRSVGFDEIATRISMQGSTVSKSDILAVLEEMETVCGQIVLEGNRVILGGLAQLFPRIKGVFTNQEDGFDGSRHRLDVGANPGKRIRRTVRTQGRVEKVDSAETGPRLLTFTDVATGEINTTATPGDLCRLVGRNLRFDPEAVDEGIFFVPTGGGAEVEVGSVSVSRPSLLSFLIPDLPTGSYVLEVRMRMRNSTALHTGRLKPSLTVPSD